MEVVSQMMFYYRFPITVEAQQANQVTCPQPGQVTWKLLESDVISVKGDFVKELLMSKKIHSIILP